MAVQLSPDQELATKAFLDALGEAGAGSVSRATAVRFLFARKFDVQRAHALWRQHEATRRREGLSRFEPFSEPLKSELETGKFTILPARDATGAAVALFTANKHFPATTTHQTTLQGVVYQLDAALQSPATQRAGLLFIYDMTDSKYNNFDYELSQKILTLLKGAYPAKLKKVLIVTAPLWFKAPFRILRLFVREKLRERVHTVSGAQLAQHVPRAALPARLGGAARVDHKAWLEHCRARYAGQQSDKLSDDDYVITHLLPDNGVDPLECDMSSGLDSDSNTMHISGERDAYSYTHSPIRSTHSFNGEDGSMKGRHSADEDELDFTKTWSAASSPSPGSPLPGAPAAPAGPDGPAPAPAGPAAALLARVRALGRRGLLAEYDEIRARPLQGTTLHAKLPYNQPKNRYTDVLCYDHSRVVLSTVDDEPGSDYINANYVDGYQHKNAFICTQGPLPRTYADFWRMVWEQHSLVIVMTTKVTERGRVKCGQYWPAAAGGAATHGALSVAAEAAAEQGDVVHTRLRLTHVKTQESRTVHHLQYTRWPDYGVPGGRAPVVRFMEDVRRTQRDALAELGSSWTGHPRGPPIVVHCSAGIGRTGTFITLEVCAARLAAAGAAAAAAVDVRGAVLAVRAQRPHSIQMPDQYVFCHLALLEYAVMQGYLESADLDEFDDDNDESD